MEIEYSLSKDDIYKSSLIIHKLNKNNKSFLKLFWGLLPLTLAWAFNYYQTGGDVLGLKLVFGGFLIGLVGSAIVFSNLMAPY